MRWLFAVSDSAREGGPINTFTKQLLPNSPYMEKEPTIYDIAKSLKLSAATVSRALNDHPPINS